MPPACESPRQHPGSGGLAKGLDHATVFTIHAVPTGNVVVSGGSYDAPCGAIASLQPTWVVEAEPVAIPAPPAVGNVTLKLKAERHRRGLDRLPERPAHRRHRHQRHRLAAGHRRRRERLAGGAACGGAAADDPTGTSAIFANPIGLAFGPGGDLFILDATPNLTAALRQVSMTGTHAVTTLAGSLTGTGYADGPGGSARMQNPRSLAWDRARFFYFTDENTLRSIDTSTSFAAGAVYLGDNNGFIRQISR